MKLGWGKSKGFAQGEKTVDGGEKGGELVPVDLVGVHWTYL